MNKYLVASYMKPEYGSKTLTNFDIIEALDYNKALEKYNIKYNLNLNFFWSEIIQEIYKE